MLIWTSPNVNSVIENVDGAEAYMIEVDVEVAVGMEVVLGGGGGLSLREDIGVLDVVDACDMLVLDETVELVTFADVLVNEDDKTAAWVVDADVLDAVEEELLEADEEKGEPLSVTLSSWRTSMNDRRDKRVGAVSSIRKGARRTRKTNRPRRV